MLPTLSLEEEESIPLTYKYITAHFPGLAQLGTSITSGGNKLAIGGLTICFCW